MGLIVGLIGVLLALRPLASWADQLNDTATQPTYSVFAADGDTLDRPRPTLPDLSPYTAEATRARVGEARVAPQVELRGVFKEFTLDDFTAGERAKTWAKRQFSRPQAIFIRSGHVTPADVARLLNQPRYFEEVEPRIFIARLPVVVEQGATLLIDGQETKEMRFSQQRGAFLVVDGRFFVFDASVVAWNEATQSQALFEHAKQFRPFYVAWGGSETYFVNASFLSFGYQNSKSYGFTFSQYGADVPQAQHRPSPKAWIINSHFSDNYFGFYCYESEGLVVLGNTYQDNIVYGIDPHDRSRHLVLANNHVFGTRKKHGIIVSREVNDSWIFGNNSHNNALSGMVLDRASERNVLADNVVHHNGSDGITVYESSNNVMWENTVHSNGKHGIRARNSTGIKLYHNDVVSNGGYGIYGHVKDLSGTGRNFVLDPYVADVSLVVNGGILMS
ncbi:MAG: right-handed parallel beta-helix repeat-containing protein, partial [Gammaproteobacteria bacterium]